MQSKVFFESFVLIDDFTESWFDYDKYFAGDFFSIWVTQFYLIWSRLGREL